MRRLAARIAGLSRSSRWSALCCLLLAIAFAGCRSVPPEQRDTRNVPVVRQTPASPSVAQVAHTEPIDVAELVLGDPDDPFAGQSELSPESLVDAVFERNPSLAAMTAAWRAAAQRYRQEVALDDPMFGFALGPDSWGSGEVEDAYMLEASQRLPWPGKRQAKGRIATAEASAARWELGDVRLKLAQAARLAFLDYYLAERQLALNVENTQILEELREAAQAKYRANLVGQQDLLQSDVELAELARRTIEIERSRAVAIAEINTLLRRLPDHPLPPPPARLVEPPPHAPVELLRQLAVERRPDLAAIAARIRAERAAVTLASKEFYPDFEAFAKYDAFWQPPEEELRTQIGVNLNLPLGREKRRAALREAMFEVSRQKAEHEAKVAEIQGAVQTAYAQVEEGHKTVALYRDRIVPAAEQNVDSARAAYVAGSSDFLPLIESQRRLVMLREQAAQAEADLHRRVADLERAAGGPLPAPDSN